MAVMAMCVLLSCTEKKEEATLSGLMKSNFVSEVQGKPTALYVLKNQNGAEACVTNWGGRLVSVMVPDKNGKMTDVVLGYDNIQQYVDNPNNNYGGLIGRYGNRIANGKFTLDGVEYQLPQNNNGHCLHGGPEGYHTVVWDAKQVNDQSVELTYLSKDGEAGFPGNLKVSVRYILTPDNTLRMDYRVSTDEDTIINLTNHTYFNLDGGGNVLGQKLRIYASNYLEGNNETCPTGKILPVDGTPMDFRTGKPLGRDLDTGFYQTTMAGGGFDHCYVLDRPRGASQSLCAWASSDKTGISMKMYTTQPGIQLYTGNFLQNCPSPGKGGVPLEKYGGFALETQHFPCSPSHPEFPTTVLRAGKVFRANTTLRFFTGRQCGRL